jgi:cell division protein FtsI (penicillin-binding protein 3)
MVVGRLLFLQVFTDRSGAAQLGNPLIPPRADILDRNGVPLARTIDAWSIGVHPGKLLGDPKQLSERLAVLMPERTAAEYEAILRSGKNFQYLSRRAVPEMVSAVNALGEPAIVFDREPERLYPQTALAGHILGWTDFDGRGVTGMEKVLEGRLIDPAQRGTPVSLSIDSRVQAAMESELGAAVLKHSAEGATGIVLDVQTGELVAMASMPTFNPNAAGKSDPNALFNRATLGVYELGSTFKPITGRRRHGGGRHQVGVAALPVGRAGADRPLPDQGRPPDPGQRQCRRDPGPFVQHRHGPDRRPDGPGADAGRVPRSGLPRTGACRARERPAALPARVEPGDRC